LIDVVGQISFADFRAAQYVHLRPRPWLRYVGTLLLMLALVVLLVGLCADFATPSSHTNSLLMAALLVYIAAFFFVYLPWRYRRLYRQQKALHGPIRFQVAETGVTTTSSVGQVVFPWSHFHKWKEGKVVFLLYFSDALFTAVPKRFFDRHDDMVAFRNLLNANVRRAT
jgi:hypothetical protein